MTVTWQPTDVPAVNIEQLAVPMQILVDNGRGLALFTGLASQDRARLERDFWQTFEGSDEDGHAVMLRFDELVRVFSAERLKTMLLDNGYAMIWQAISIAATMRLNAERGFSPQKFVWALRHQNNSSSPTDSPPAHASKHLGWQAKPSTPMLDNAA